MMHRRLGWTVALVLVVGCTPALRSRPPVAPATVEGVATLIQDRYVGEVDPATLQDAARTATDRLLASDPDASAEKRLDVAASAMLASLDPQSSYLSPELYHELRMEGRQPFAGVGLEITRRNGPLTVVAPLADSPAERAGVPAGSIILAISGESTEGMSLVQAVRKFRGPRGTSVTLQLAREPGGPPFEVTLVREVVKIRNVDWRLLEGRYGYVRLAQFGAESDAELQRALAAVDREGAGVEGLVLDLRGNSGGLLTQAIKVADVFLEAGLIASTESRYAAERRRYYAHTADTWKRAPMAVLVDHGSAAASEVVAAALRHHGRAVLVGSRTFGRGNIQTIIAVGDDAALKLTTAWLQTPAGAPIEGVGIQPDLAVEGERPIAAGAPDPVLDAALERLRALTGTAPSPPHG